MYKRQNYYDLFGQQYQGQDTTSAGSGFIVGQNDKELLIATNNHVIDGAKTISVQFIDEQIYEATVKGTDSSNDLAMFRHAGHAIAMGAHDQVLEPYTEFVTKTVEEDGIAYAMKKYGLID